MIHAIRVLLAQLDFPNAYIAYTVMTTEATLYDGSAGPPRIASTVSREHLEIIFEKNWITRYDTQDGVHRYRLSELGREALNGSGSKV